MEKINDLENLLWYAKEATCTPDPNYYYEFQRLATPRVIVDIIESLKVAQQSIDELEKAKRCLVVDDKFKVNGSWIGSVQNYIVYLESRTATVKLPDLRQIVSGDRYVWSDGVYNYSQDVKVALTTAGIKVEAE